MTHLSAWDQERLKSQLYRALVRLGLMVDRREFHKWNKYRVERTVNWYKNDKD